VACPKRVPEEGVGIGVHSGTLWALEKNAAKSKKTVTRNFMQDG
jgi:hypothetical protein